LIQPRQHSRIETKRHAVVASQNKPQHANVEERHEMQWLVRTTSRLLRHRPTTTNGLLSKHMIYEAHTAMKLWSDRTSHKKGSTAPHVVEKILTRLVAERDKGNDHVIITTKVYNIVIDAWSKSDYEGAAQRAEEILVQMERLWTLGNHDVKPDQDSYHGVIKAWVKHGNRRDSISKVEAIINRMTQVEGFYGKKLSPGRRGYNLLLYALANSNETDAAERALAVLQTMKEEFKAGCDQSQPNLNTYNQVITALGRRRGFEQQAQAIFDEVIALPDVEPDTDIFNVILKCWLRSNEKDKLDCMNNIINVMRECEEDGNYNAIPDLVTANTMLAARSRARGKDKETSLDEAIAFYRDMEDDYHVTPDTVSNNILMDCWSKSGRSDSLEHVLEILELMEKEFKAGNPSVKPDAYSYASAIDCVAKSGNADADKRAESLLERMRELHSNNGGDAPTTPVYNACLNALATLNNDDETAVARAESILREMEERHTVREDIPAPNRETYNTVLKALSNNGKHASRAEALLSQMEERARHDISLAPDSYSYTSVITAYARSREPGKAAKALEILQRMIASYENGNLAAKPMIHAFNSCLNACAFTISGNERHRTEAFLITVSTIVLLQKYSQPDSLSFSTTLRACSTLLHPDDERRDFISESVFKRACREGQVDRNVIRQLKFASSSELYQSLVGVKRANDTIRIRDLPREWSSSVRQQYRTPR